MISPIFSRLFFMIFILEFTLYFGRKSLIPSFGLWEEVGDEEWREKEGREGGKGGGRGGGCNFLSSACGGLEMINLSRLAAEFDK